MNLTWVFFYFLARSSRVLCSWHHNIACPLGRWHNNHGDQRTLAHLSYQKVRSLFYSNPLTGSYLFYFVPWKGSWNVAFYLALVSTTRPRSWMVTYSRVRSKKAGSNSVTTCSRFSTISTGKHLDRYCFGHFTIDFKF